MHRLYHPPTHPTAWDCLSSLHNPAGLLSPSLMYGGWWCNKMATNAGGWQRLPDRALILMSFMLIMCFYSSSQACWGMRRGALHAILPRLWCISLLIFFLLHKPRSNILAFMAWLWAFYCQGNRYKLNRGENLRPQQCNKILNPLFRWM